VNFPLDPSDLSGLPAAGPVTLHACGHVQALLGTHRFSSPRAPATRRGLAALGMLQFFHRGNHSVAALAQDLWVTVGEGRVDPRSAGSLPKKPNFAGFGCNSSNLPQHGQEK
jgi:hypothetical protein